MYTVRYIASNQEGITRPWPDPPPHYTNCDSIASTGSVEDDLAIILGRAWGEIRPWRPGDHGYVVEDMEDVETGLRLKLINGRHRNYFVWVDGYRRGGPW